MLVECDQPVPDFLEPYRPSDEDLTFADDDSDGEVEKAASGGAEPWAAADSDNDEVRNEKDEDGGSARGQDAATAESTHDGPVDEPAEEPIEMPADKESAVKRTTGRMPVPTPKTVDKADILW